MTNNGGINKNQLNISEYVNNIETNESKNISELVRARIMCKYEDRCTEGQLKLVKQEHDE